MALKVYRLRRWLAVMAVMFSAVVAGMYFYARLRQHSVLRGFPAKISYDVKQTASGFQFSKSDGGRTVFTIRARSVKEFKLNGRADLHDVSITLYGRDTSRFDRIYGDDFSFDPKSGDVTAKGEVEIDLEANPAGLEAPDQATPAELKNPIHLSTRDLVFNRDTGDAATHARVDFRTPQATGWAMGMQYAAKSATLTLASQIHLTLAGEKGTSLLAMHGTITREPRQVVLDQPVMMRESGTLRSDQAIFFLGAENEVQRVLATGNVNAEASGRDAEPMLARADQAELLLSSRQNLLRTASLSGQVHVERGGSQPIQGDAGVAVLDFRGQNELEKVHAAEGVRLMQHAESPGRPLMPVDAAQQDFELTAPIVDFFVAHGRRLDRAETSGAAKITLTPAQASATQTSAGKSAASSVAQRTVITAGRFQAKFAATPQGPSRLTTMHGSPDARIVNLAPGVPDRVSTSQSLDAAFLPGGGIASIVQRGGVVYSDGLPPEKRTQAWADEALYTPADRVLLLTGAPRVSEGGMTTTAKGIRMNRSTGDAFAEGDVKSTYSELKEQPNGAWLASSSPIHVTAATMSAHNSPATALYQGNARLWQDANLVEAPSIQFDREDRSLVAEGSASQPVSTVLVQGEKPQADANSTSAMARQKTSQGQEVSEDRAKEKARAKKGSGSGVLTITAVRLTYTDSDREARYETDVIAQGTGFRATADKMDVYFSLRSQAYTNKSFSGSSRLDHMVAEGRVVMQQPGRRAQSEKLVYTASEDKFVLTGGPPSIFDAERGKITGDSLTFFRADDRVLVESEHSTPVVTQTRVAR
jgi:lipopolysaccharide export system protein LptA